MVAVRPQSSCNRFGVLLNLKFPRSMLLRLQQQIQNWPTPSKWSRASHEPDEQREPYNSLRQRDSLMWPFRKQADVAPKTAAAVAYLKVAEPEEEDAMVIDLPRDESP